MPVEHVTSTDFRARVLESEFPVVVDFWAEWCGPCHQIAPKVEELSRRWASKVRFTKLDTEANQDVARAYSIRSIPALLLFDGGEPQAWSIGVKPAYLIVKELGLAKRTGYNPDKEARAARKAARRARRAGAERSELLGRLFRPAKR